MLKRGRFVTRAFKRSVLIFQSWVIGIGIFFCFLILLINAVQLAGVFSR